MKKVKKIICILLALVVLFFVGKAIAIEVIVNSEYLSVKTMINNYEKIKTDESLYELCEVLKQTSNYEDKEKYYKIFIYEGCAEKLAEEAYCNSAYLKQIFVDEYKHVYFLTLLHLNKFDEFEKKYKDSVNDITGQNMFYSVLFFELNNLEWTEKQLLVLENVLEEDLKKDFFNDDLLFENTYLKTKIYEMTNNKKFEKNNELIYEYIKQPKPEDIKESTNQGSTNQSQSGDGSMIDTLYQSGDTNQQSQSGDGSVIDTLS